MKQQLMAAMVLSVVLYVPAGGMAQQAEMAPQAKVAALAQFADRVGTLEQLASDIALAASLSVLTMSQPDLQFESEGKWSSKVRKITNDLSGVAASVGYGLPKLRGKLVKSAVATEAQTAEAKAIFEAVKELILQADALTKLVEAGDADAATSYLGAEVLASAQEIRARADALSGEVQLAIKLAGL